MQSGKVFLVGLILTLVLILAFGIWRMAKATLIPLEIRGQKFWVELAVTTEEQTRGLAGRKEIRRDGGMLFVFTQAHMATFWMKGMLVPLDFLWIKDKLIVDLHRNVPLPSGEILPTYTSKEDVDMMLELPAGTIDRLGVERGDIIQLDETLLQNESNRHLQ